MLTTNQLGLVAETAILHECVKLGVGVSRPLDDERYDLILDLRPQLLRVQCKWAVRAGDVVAIRCYTARRGPGGMIVRRYFSAQIDVLAAYCAELDRCYLLPMTLATHRTVHLRLAPSRNNQLVGISWARDYE